MNQIRIFTHFDVTSLETDVNQWLKDNPVKIVNIISNVVSKGSQHSSVSDMMEWMVVIHYQTHPQS